MKKTDGENLNMNRLGNEIVMVNKSVHISLVKRGKLLCLLMSAPPSTSSLWLLLGGSLCSTALHCTTLHCTVLNCVEFHMLYYTTLQIILHCTVILSTLWLDCGLRYNMKDLSHPLYYIAELATSKSSQTPNCFNG